MPRLYSTDLQERLDAEPRVDVDLLETRPDQDPVDPGERNDVRDSSHGHQVQVFHQGRLLPFLEKSAFPESFPQSGDKIKGQPDTGKGLVRKGALGKKGINKGCGVRQFDRGFMMVRNNNAHTERVGIGNFLNGGDTAVHGNDEPDPLFVELPDTLLIDPVSLFHPLGDVVMGGETEIPQK